MSLPLQVLVFACQVLLPDSRVITLVSNSEVVTVAKVVKQQYRWFAKTVDHIAEPGDVVLMPEHKSCKPTKTASDNNFMMPQLIHSIALPPETVRHSDPL